MRALKYWTYFDFAPLRSIGRQFERNEQIRRMKSKTNSWFCKALLISSLMTVLLPTGVAAQEFDLGTLTLQESIELAQENSPVARANRYSLISSRWAFESFKASGSKTDQKRLKEFKKRNSYWLDDYTLFMACSISNDRKPWNKWEKDLAQRKPAAIKKAAKRFSDEIEYQTWLQFEFFEQWNTLKDYANSKNIRVVGDIPIFVDHNSADVWSHPEFFAVDKQGNRELVAGVPPDYFSETGQLWGNPLYKWSAIKKDGFSWWLERFKQMFDLFDAIRVDHFRGFDEYWEVKASEQTAINGEWVKAPGVELFTTIKEKLGSLPIIAEDLGLMTQGVEDLRDQFNFPGMKILQFAFDSDSTNSFLPHNYPQNCVTYTGTHDNDTTIGWYTSAPGVEQHRAREYTRSDGSNIQWELIRLGMFSVADQAIFPLQDFMNLDSKHRMNTPGTVGDNWMWRYTPDMLQNVDKQRIRKMAEMSNRLP